MKILPMIVSVALMSTSVLAYTGQSDWAEKTLETADANNIIPNVLKNADVSKPITRAEFAAVAVRLYDAMSENDAEAADYNPFTDTSDRDVLKAYAAGITNGVTDTTFEPESLISREQVAVMLARVYTLVEGKEIDPAFDSKFDDDSSISDWAKNEVYFMSECGIIDGMGGNLFAPDNNASREQAVVISQRMLEKFRPSAVITPEPATSEIPEQTASPTEKPDVFEGNLLSRIPMPSFGTITESNEDEYGATVVIEGATLEDFESYSANVEGIFPTHINNLENSFIIRSDGKYEIKVNYADGVITVTLEPVE